MQIACGDDIADKNRLARARNASHAALTKLAEDADPNVRIGVASNPSTPPDVLHRLVTTEQPKHEWTAVRLSVARNPGAPVDTLLVLARDRDGMVREDAHDNPMATPEVKGIVEGLRYPAG